MCLAAGLRTVVGPGLGDGEAQGTGVERDSKEYEWCGMKMGRGLPFYKTVGQLKGPLEAKEPLDAKFRYDCEIFACTNFHLQNNNKNLIKVN